MQENQQTQFLFCSWLPSFESEMYAPRQTIDGRDCRQKGCSAYLGGEGEYLCNQIPSLRILRNLGMSDGKSNNAALSTLFCQQTHEVLIPSKAVYPKGK